MLSVGMIGKLVLLHWRADTTGWILADHVRWFPGALVDAILVAGLPLVVGLYCYDHEIAKRGRDGTETPRGS